MIERIRIVMLGVVLASPLVGHAEGYYGGIGLGKAKINSQFDTVAKSNGLAAKLYGGYEFTKNWGVEVGYANLGASQDTIIDSVNAITYIASYHFTSSYLVGTSSLPIAERFALFAKFGLSANRIAGTLNISNAVLASGNKVITTLYEG